MPIRSDRPDSSQWAKAARFLSLTIMLIVMVSVATSALAAKKSYRYEDDPVRLGVKAIEEGNLEEAEAQFLEAIENEHQVYKARYGLAEIEYINARYGEAEPLYRLAIIEKNRETGKDDYPKANAGLGMVLLRLDRIEEAKQSFEQAIRQKGNLWLARYGMARIQVIEEDWSGAKKNLEKGKKKKGYEEREDLYCYGMALVQLHEGEVEEAEKNALKALNLNPNDSAYGTLVADIFTQRGARTLAIQEYEKVLQLVGARARAPVHHDLGLLYEAEKRYEEALTQYNFAVTKDSTFAPAWKSSGDLYAIARGKERDAAGSYLRYTQLRPDDPEGFLGLAKAAIKVDSRGPALQAGEQAFALDSTNVEIRLTLARASFLNKDRPRAKRLYESLSDTTDFEAIDHVRMGQLKLDAKEYDGARGSLTRAIDMDSTLADAYFALGLVFLNQAQKDSAVVEFNMAIAADSTHAAALLNLGVVYMQMSQPCDAAGPLRTAVDLAPTHTGARTYLALALVNCSPDSIPTAIVAYKNVLEQEPQNAGALRGLGFCYLKRGDHGQAVGVLKRATDAAPENPDTWVMLGQARALSGDMPGAARAFRKALDVNPEHPGAKKGMEAVQPHLEK